MRVSHGTVSTDGILVAGAKAALENGVANGVPRLEGAVPIFDQQWCPIGDKNGHSNHWRIVVSCD